MKNFLPIILLMFALVALDCKNDAKKEADVAKDPRIEKAPEKGTNPFDKNTCDILTDDDIQKIFNVDPKMVNKRTTEGIAACMRYWNKPDWKEREANNEKPGAKFLNPQVMTSIKIVNDFTAEAAKNQYEMELKNKKDQDQIIEGIGDAAFWRYDYSSLQVLKGHLLVIITLVGEDTQEANIPKLKELAQVILAKLP